MMSKSPQTTPPEEVHKDAKSEIEEYTVLLFLLGVLQRLARTPSESLKTVFTWWVVAMIAGLFLVYSFIAYYFIGQKWPPPWRFGTVEDVPGISEYSSRGAQEGTALGQVQEERVQRQHVMGHSVEKSEKTGLWEFLRQLGDESGLPTSQKRP